MRKCIASGHSLPVQTLVRFVRDAEKPTQLRPDPFRKLPGRGVWIRLERPLLARALGDARLLSRAFRTRIDHMEKLLPVLEGMLARRTLDFLALARRAKQAVCGISACRTLMAKDKSALIFVSLNGAPIALEAKTPEQNVLHCLTGQELARVFSKSRTEFVAVKTGNMQEKLLVHARRLEMIRTKEALP